MRQELVIIGGGPYSRALVEEIKNRDKEIPITVIDKNCFSFDKRCLFDFKLTPEKLDLISWAKERKVTFLNQFVKTIDPQRKKIYFKEGASFSYKNLVVATGLISKKLSIRGEHLKGVFYFSEINPVDFLDCIKISQEVIIYASGILGMILAQQISNLGREVRIVVNERQVLGERENSILSALEQKGVMVYYRESITEAIGEGSLKAVKISGKKIFSSQMLILDTPLLPALDFFNGEVYPKGKYFTNFPEIYFLGKINLPENERARFNLLNEDISREVKDFCNCIFHPTNLYL